MPIRSSFRSSFRASPGPARVSARGDLWRVVAAGLLWGTGGLTGALLAHAGSLHPLAIAAYRLAAGGLLVLAVLACTGRLRLPGRSWLRRVLTVGVLAALYQACYFASVALTSVGLATMVTLGSAPVLVLAAEALRYRRRPDRASCIAIVLAVLGLAVLLGLPLSGDAATAGGVGLGGLLAVVSAAGFAGITLLGRRPVEGLDGPATVGLGFTVGAVLLGSVCAATVGLGFTPTPTTIGLLVYLGAVPTALAYALYFAGLRGVPAASATVVAVLEPLTASVLGSLVLGERLGPAGMAGAALLCLAVLVAGQRR